MHVCTCPHATVHVEKPEDNFEELGLSFHYMTLKIEFKLSGLVARVLSIEPSHQPMIISKATVLILSFIFIVLVFYSFTIPCFELTPPHHPLLIPSHHPCWLSPSLLLYLFILLLEAQVMSSKFWNRSCCMPLEIFCKAEKELIRR